MNILLRHTLLVVAFVLVVADLSHAQSLPRAMTRRIDSIFARYDRKDVPGCALGVYHNGKLVYAKGYGMADLEHDVPITPQTRFDIGSTSKQFTAASILLLEQQGKLSLDDDVRKYIGELPHYGYTITIRQLLNHTAGIRDYIILMAMGGTDIDDVTSNKDALVAITRQKGLNFDPGAEHLYSNSGYFLASIIVERVSGKSLRQFAAENIFRPLGMTSTSYIDDHTEIVPRRAIGYDAREGGGFRRDVSYWEQNGDGGVFSTVEDLRLWDENFYNPKVGGRKMVDELLRRGVLKNGDTIDYALGLTHSSIRGVPVVEHSGAWGGYRAQLMRVPSEHFSVAVLSNVGTSDPSTLARRVIEVVLEGRLPRESVSAPAASRQRVAIDATIFDAYAGEYSLDIQPNFILTFRRSGIRYFSQATGQGELELFPTSDSTFMVDGVDASLTFHRDPGGTVSSLTLHQGGDYTARRVRTFAVSADSLKSYEGSYYSSELETTYSLTLEEGRLTLADRGGDAVALLPVQPNVFTGEQGFPTEVRFERDQAGNVRAMVISMGRIRGLRFVR